MIQYQSTQYNSTIYNRHYKHSDNFKKMIFGQSLATSTHHWLVILPISASNSGESEYLLFIHKGASPYFPEMPTKKTSGPIVDFLDPPSTKVLDIPSSLVAEFFQQKRYLGVGRSGPWQEIPMYSWRM